MDVDHVATGDAESIRQALDLYGEVLYSLYTSPKPAVCIVDGAVKAGGVGIVSACDIVLSSNQTTFEMGEVLFGLIPANVLPYLLAQRVNPQKARYLVLTAKKLDAEESYRLGLVDELFEDKDFERGVRNVLKGLLRSSPAALAEAKRFTHLLLGKDLQEARSMAAREFIKMIGSPEVLRGIEAFSAGELPEWFGRYRPQRPLVGED
jgi:enoyl-CoA hydratase/carnithine racemase